MTTAVSDLAFRAYAPEFDEERGHQDREYRQQLSGYYNR